MIRRQRMELGLGEGGLRHRKNSPTWGVRLLFLPFSFSQTHPLTSSRQGNRRHGTSRDRVAVEEVEDEEDHDYEEAGGAERSDRGPVIGAHLGSLKDKRKEVRLGGVKRGTAIGWSASIEGEVLISSTQSFDRCSERAKLTSFPLPLGAGKQASTKLCYVSPNRLSPPPVTHAVTPLSSLPPRHLPSFSSPPIEPSLPPSIGPLPRERTSPSLFLLPLLSPS